MLSYTLAPCPVGQLLLAWNERGICALSLGDEAEGLEAELQALYPAPPCQRLPTSPWLAPVLAYLAGHAPALTLPLDPAGSDFQQAVWAALRTIPYGSTWSYSELTAYLERPPTSVRAVAQACGANQIALLIPCHRVTQGDGGLAGYRWGIERKRWLLEMERGWRAEQLALI